MKFPIKIFLFTIIIIIVLNAVYFFITNLYTGESGYLSSSYSSFKHPLRIIDLDNAETVRISQESPSSHPTDPSCNHFNCFDIFRCDPLDEIKIYLYPIRKYINDNEQPVFKYFSREYYQLIKEVRGSPFYVSDPSTACIYIPTIDTLDQKTLLTDEASQALESLPFWKSYGRNHLLFNFFPGTPENSLRNFSINIGKAVLAAGNLDTWNYRNNFDVSIPVYSPRSRQYIHRTEREKKFLIESKRSQMIISLETDFINPEYKKILEILEINHPSKLFLYVTNCNPPLNKSSLRCNTLRGLRLRYTELVRSSDFCIIMATGYLSSPLLSDALMFGCIPVIIIDSYVLPFHNKIDWTSISIRIQERALPHIVDILNAISIDRIIEYKEQGLFIWKQYFSSMKAIFMSTIQIIKERISPQFAISKFRWNKPKLAERISNTSPVNSKLISRPLQGFTAVILTYDRFESLCQVILGVVQSPNCVKIVVVWNNQNRSPPSQSLWPKINVPISIIVTKENKLSNRFFPYNDITTDAIFAIDDDIVMLTGDELEFAYQVWREMSDVIVGFPSRVHRWNNQTQSWRYESEWTNDVSMVLTGAAFYHKVRNVTV